ncbi:MAG: zinc ribbon domain-containing protein [Halanaerobium sp.]|nr:zinc ribbon domain-containing protein [Halanaerobium sp.]
MDLENKFAQKYKCDKCGNVGAITKKLSMTGTGLSKLLDIQANKYLFVSCRSCGYTEVYNLAVLTGKKGVELMDVLDFFMD